MEQETMKDRITEQMRRVQEKYKAMSNQLQEVEKSRNEIVQEMLKLEGAFRELKVILDELEAQSGKEDNEDG
mgnify:FL=1